MKKITITAAFLGVLAMGLWAKTATAQVQVNISIGGFYDELSPYGQWVDCEYGDCWVPDRVYADWQPYSNGEWIYTDYGWTWLSDDPWGDDPYHYGTWTYLPRYGWAWVPGTVWAPAWVTWNYNDNYVGWAPLPPNYSFGYSGYSGRPIVLSPTRYVFVPTNRFFGSNVRTFRIGPAQAATIFRQTTPITSFGVTGGIVRNTALPIERIQRATRTRIERRSVRRAPRPISGWTRDSRRQVSIVAPARDVRAAIASRPQKGRGNERVRGNSGGNGRVNRQPETRQQAAPSRVERQPVVLPPVQTNSNEKANRDRGRGRPEARQQAAPQAQQPQAGLPPVQSNPQTLEKSQRGRGQEKSAAPAKGQGKGKSKDKDKDKGKP
jgi:hypothetical protein